jgi:hypothetical protein
MTINPSLDPFGKVTVSLGAHCPLACAHCYTNTPGFHVDPKRAVEAAISVVASLPGARTICLSGDTDPFLRPVAAIEFLERAAREFPSTHLMLTTRLIPPKEIEERFLDLSRSLSSQGRLCVAGISFVTRSYPNAIEDPARVPDPGERIEFLQRLSNGPQPVLLALRPTLPFHVVPPEEVEAIVVEVGRAAGAVLGEVLLLDEEGVIADRLGIPVALTDDELGPLSFLNQPSPRWRKRNLPEESSFVAALCERVGVPQFMRSVSAMRFFEVYWDLKKGICAFRPGDRLDLSAEATVP